MVKFRSWRLDPVLVYYTAHAEHRMLERGVSEEDIAAVLANCWEVESYAAGERYYLPGLLVHGRIGTRDLHIVLTLDAEAGAVSVITVYDPIRQPGTRRSGKDDEMPCLRH